MITITLDKLIKIFAVSKINQKSVKPMNDIVRQLVKFLSHQIKLSDKL